MKTKKIYGQDSYELKTPDVELALTQLGGHLAPVIFKLGKKKGQPFSIAPWHAEKLPAGIDPLLHVLRGDFFCLPFGGNATPVKKLKLNCHGDTANAPWTFVDAKTCDKGAYIHLWQKQPFGKKARVDKRLYLRKGQTAVYQEHLVSGVDAELPVGHHPTLDFSGKSARLSAGPFTVGYVNPQPFENPANKGYSALQHGSSFTSLKKVKTVCGGTADLSVYPARRGFEDLVIMVNDRKKPFAWQAAVVQKEGWIYYALKDPKTLGSSAQWITNGGRHYAPWNGRHTDRIGLEDTTSYFADGWAESIGANALKKKGIPTALKFSSKKPTAVRYIIGVAAAPKSFDEVKTIERVDANHIRLVARNGKKIIVPLNIDFLQKGEKAL